MSVIPSVDAVKSSNVSLRETQLVVHSPIWVPVLSELALLPEAYPIPLMTTIRRDVRDSFAAITLRDRE